MDVVIEAVTLIAPIIIIALFSLPSYVSLLRQRGILIGLLIAILIGAYVLAIETLVVKTGIPYGKLEFDSALGYKLFGTTPWVIAVAYPPIVLAAFWLASKFTRTWWRGILTGLFAVLIDLVIDPAAVKLGFWKWENGGPFYGVPILNFVGWVLTASVAGWILHLLWSGERAVLRGIAYSGLILSLFWAGANIGMEQWISAAIGGILGITILILAAVEKIKAARETSE